MTEGIDPDKLAERLAALDKPFHEAPSEGFSDMPEDGTYQGVVKEWRFAETKDKKAALLILTMEVTLDPKYDGREVDKLWNLEPHVQDPSLTPEQVQQRLGFLKRDLKRFGIDVDAEDFSYADVRPGSDLLEEQLDRSVEFVIKTKDGFQNVYLNYVGDRVPGGAAAQRSDIPSDLTDQQALPGDFATAKPGNAIGDDDDIPF